MSAGTRAAEARAIEADIPMGMTQIGEGDAKVLLVRDENGLRAFQATCPHYGAPLAKGEICGHHAVLPRGTRRPSTSVTVRSSRRPRCRGWTNIPSAPRARRSSSRSSRWRSPAPRRGRIRAPSSSSAPGRLRSPRSRRCATKASAARSSRSRARRREPYDRPKLSKNFLAKPTDAAAMVLEKDFFASHDVDGAHGSRQADRAHKAHP